MSGNAWKIPQENRLPFGEQFLRSESIQETWFIEDDSTNNQGYIRRITEDEDMEHQYNCRFQQNHERNIKSLGEFQKWSAAHPNEYFSQAMKVIAKETQTSHSNVNDKQAAHSIRNRLTNPPYELMDVNRSWSGSGITNRLLSEDRLDYYKRSVGQRDLEDVPTDDLDKIKRNAVPVTKRKTVTGVSRFHVNKTPANCGATRKYLQENSSSTGIQRNSSQGDEKLGNDVEVQDEAIEQKEKLQANRKQSKNQKHILALLRYQIAEALVDEECKTCYNKQKRCCCCFVCNLCCHCVCPKICKIVFEDANRKISSCELNVMRRLGVCSNCDSPLCSAALHAFQSFTRSLDAEELLREYLHQCWEDVSYLICLSNYENEFTKTRTRGMLGCQLPQKYVKTLMQRSIAIDIPPHRHCESHDCRG